VRLPPCGGHVLRQNADHQIPTDDAAAHLAVAQEREPAEHLALSDSGRAPQHFPNALSQFLIKWHRLIVAPD
jgi:hypothetical protein